LYAHRALRTLPLVVGVQHTTPAAAIRPIVPPGKKRIIGNGTVTHISTLAQVCTLAASRLARGVTTGSIGDADTSSGATWWCAAGAHACCTTAGVACTGATGTPWTGTGTASAIGGSCTATWIVLPPEAFAGHRSETSCPLISVWKVSPGPTPHGTLTEWVALVATLTWLAGTS